MATNRALVEVGRLLRRYHDAVSGFALPPDVEWYHESDPGPGSVVCHNDLSPKNTVFRDGWTAPPHRLSRLRSLCDAYGLAEEDRWSFSELVARRIGATDSGMESNASAGVPEFKRLVALGIPTLVRADQARVERHRELLREALLGP